MFNLGQRGIATVAAVVAVVAVAGAATGTPMAVDEADVNPNSPLYSLERIGEQIKETTYAGGQEWDLDRAMERTREYEEVASRELANNHVNLLDDAGNRIFNATTKADDNRGLQRAQEVIQEHEQVLERVRNRVNENSKPAISLALSRSARARMVMKDVESGEIPPLEKGGKERIAERLRSEEREMNRQRENVRESIRSGRKPSEVSQRVEIRTAEEMTKKFDQMAEKGKAEEYTALAEEAQKQLQNAAHNADDNTGLQRAIDAVQKHVQVLERVRGNIPENARQGIERAIQNSQKAVNVLENVARGIGERIPPGLGGEIPGKGRGNGDENESDNQVGPPDERGPGEDFEIPGNGGPDDNDDNEEIPEDNERGPGDSTPGNSAQPLNFVHGKGDLPPWVPGPPPWAEQGNGPPWTRPENDTEETPELPDEESDEEEENDADEEDTTTGDGYELLGDGVKLQDLPVSYSINPSNDYGLDSENVIHEISQAFETWDAHTSVELFDNTVSTTTESGFNQDGQNVVSFAPLSESDAIGKTKLWYDGSTVIEFDIVLNSTVDWGIDPDGEGPETIDAHDIRNITTHEVGHTLVLQDIEDTDYGHLTMYHISEPGSTVKISLENGDIEGLHALYGE